MTARTLLLIRCFAASSLALVAGPLAAITPEQLDARLKAGEAITLIDLRSTVRYQHSHIPGAINIPDDRLAEKQLPPLGHVVAYGDGLGLIDSNACLVALNAKPGISADSLEGGFAAWQTFTNIATASSNLRAQADLPTITYQQLEKTAGEDVTLIDVRRPGPQGARFDLKPFCRGCVPKAGMSTKPFELLDTLRGRSRKFTSAPSLLVVVDNDNTSAQALAQKIQASGYKRVVVLVGGEEIIKRQGKSGLARSGSAASITLAPDHQPVPIPTGGTAGAAPDQPHTPSK